MIKVILFAPSLSSSLSVGPRKALITFETHCMKHTVLLIIVVMSCQAIRAQENSQFPLVKKGAKPLLVSSEFKFTEGPAVDPEGNTFFTDQPNNRILKWTPDEGISVFMENAGRANGLYFDRNGNLLACADEKNELWQID